MKANEMETYLPREFEKLMRETVKPDMEKFVCGLEDLCDSVVAIRNGELHYYGGLHTGYRVGYLPYNQKDHVFANLWRFHNLKSVSLSSEYSETRLFMSRWPKSLESLSISGECDSTPLNSLPKLRELSLFRLDADIAVHAPIAERLKALSFGSALDESAMSLFTNLETLICGTWEDELKPLSKKLKKLFVENLERTSLDGLQCTGLEFLRLQSNRLSDISALGDCKHLRSVAIIGGYVESLAPLADKPIETLVLPQSSVLDFEPLSTMSQLKQLYINDSLIADLSCLAGLDKLECLDIQGCTAIKDVAPLVDLPNLREVKADPEAVRKLFPDELLKKLDMTRPAPCPVPRHQFCH